MRAEYLLFDLVVALPPLLIALRRRRALAGHGRNVAFALGVACLPFAVWDACVAGRHWWFHPRHVLGPRVLGLPLEEWLFFPSVGFACLFLWRSVFADAPAGWRSAHARARSGPERTLLAGLAGTGVLLLLGGLEYTGLVALALAAVVALDLSSGVALLRRRRFLAFLAAVVGLTAVFNGYLTARPVVLYADAYRLGWRVGSIPVEDFGFGVAFVSLLVLAFETRARSAAGPRRGGLVSWLVERRLGGYRQLVNHPEPGRPRQLAEPRAVAVVGAGLAGLSAAATLAERGFAVQLFEAEDHLGGKVGAWDVALAGERVPVEHGFHAFFHHYYNLRELLGRFGVTQHLVPIDDYRILCRDGRELGFREVATTPLVNLLSMARRRIYRVRDVALGPAGRAMEGFFRYDPEETFAALDAVSFARFAERARLPHTLQLVFTSFARAFFADADRISMAELVKGFHGYYLSHDHGLLYDHLDGAYGRTLIEPAREHLVARGVRIHTGRAVPCVERRSGGFAVLGQEVHGVVLATHARAAREILGASAFVAREAPELARQAAKLRCGQRYAVMRLWLDRDLERPLHAFTITERRRLLDSISVYHRIARESAAWVGRHGGGVFELHCYAVPDDVVSEQEIRRLLLADLHEVAPELRGARAVHELLQVRDDFSAFHVGMAADRPGVETPVPGLLLAGDWVRLPVPAMLMEAACTAGLLAANALLEREGLCPEPVYSVPLRGVLARRGGSAESAMTRRSTSRSSAPTPPG